MKFFALADFANDTDSFPYTLHIEHEANPSFLTIPVLSLTKPFYL
ncbi:hypothetical protein VUJ46_13030 [Chryseobacterium sp. MYb264]|nr:hypothetical protein VUJ46_13030 [Chryseobacterium sp. MYb264]